MIPTFEATATRLWMLIPDDGYRVLHAPQPGRTRILDGNIAADTLCSIVTGPVVLPDATDQADARRCPLCADQAGIGGGTGSPRRVAA